MGVVGAWKSYCVVTFQSTGWPSVVAVMSHWFGKQRLVHIHMCMITQGVVTAIGAVVTAATGVKIF